MARSSAVACATTSSSDTWPSRRPSVNANPELVVASAGNPSAASARAEPASQALGITNGAPSCSARNASPFDDSAYLSTTRITTLPRLPPVKLRSNAARASSSG